MKGLIIKLLIGCLCMSLAPLTVFAGDIGPATYHRFSWNDVYLGIDAGYSMSVNSTNFSPIHDGATSFLAPENTTFQRDIDNSGMVGALIGYNINEYVGLNLNYDYRNNFSWEVSATYPNIGLANLDYYAKKIQIQTLFANIELFPQVSWGDIRPYIKGGFGLAANKVFNVKTLNPDIPVTYLEVHGHRSINFAWNVGLGVDYKITSRLYFNLGYRFVDTGVLRSGTSFTASGAGATPAGTYYTIPFKANQILLNEILISLRWQLDK